MSIEACAPLPLILCGTWPTDRTLATALEQRLGGRRVYCLDPPPMTEDHILRRVPEWLDHHTARLRELEVEPPYLLAGYSFGGVLALEMARSFSPHLISRNAEVAYVGLIDTIRPRIRPVRLRDAIPYHLREAAFLPTTHSRRRYLERELRTRIVRRTPGWFLRAKAQLRGRRDDPGAVFEKPQEPLIRSIHRSYLNYEATPTEMPVHIYPTQGSIGRCHDPSLRWSPFLRGGYRVHNLEGSHTTLWTEPHVELLAAAVREDLDAIDPIDAPVPA